MTEEKLRELQRDLETQKQRFWDATSRSASKIQNDISDISITTWIRSYPMQTATFCFFSGFYVAQKLFHQTSAQTAAPLQKNGKPPG
jgi:hypothetical protein